MKVLVIDGLAADRLLIRSALASLEGAHQFEIAEAEDMASALVALEAETPDVVLLDLMLPDSRGTETVARIRHATTAPIVLLTVASDQDIAVATPGAGAHEFLLKSELRPHPLDRAIAFAIERARLQAELRQSREDQIRLQHRLLQNHRRQAVGQLARSVAHDFNNLLTTMLGHATMLRENEPRADAVAELDEIKRAAERAASLTRQLLALGRWQPQKREIRELNSILLDMRPAIEAVLGKTINLQWALTDGAVSVWVDSRELEQVVLNVVFNAREAMTRGGRLTISTRVLSLGTNELTEDLTPGDYAAISITDTGVGIPAEVKTRVFDPFFTTKTADGNAGLGLAAVNGIVRRSGGHVAIESETGVGTAVHIYLPAHKDLPDDAAGPRTETQPARKCGTILVVDDEPGVRNMVALALKRAGHTVLTAPGAHAALSLVNDGNADLDLVISDVVMPEMDGAEMVRQLQSARGDLPVLFMSGFNDQSLIVEGTLDIGTQLLQKPFDLSALLQRVQHLMK